MGIYARLLRVASLVVLIVVGSVSVGVIPVGAQDDEPLPGRPVRVATTLGEPWVIEEGGVHNGMFVEIWQAAAASAGFDTNPADFVVHETFADMLTAVDSGDADIGLYPITPTAERELDMDFSTGVIVSGSQIAIVRPTAGSRGLISALFSSGILKILLIGFGAVLIVAHLVWWVERGRPGIADDYRRGIFDAIWFAMVTVTTVGYGDHVPETVRGKSLALVWMVVSLFVLGGFIGLVSSLLSEEVVTQGINGPEDLAEKSVAVVEATVHEDFARESGALVIPVATQEELFAALENGTADAIINNPYSIERQQVAGDGPDLVAIEPRFREYSETIALSEDSPYAEPLNRALLELKEDGTINAIVERWVNAP